MATYILLMTLTPEGQRTALNDPEYLLRVEEAIDLPGVTALGIYAVLGAYDFVTIVEATDNDRMARFSLELGVRARAHITTLPAVPISRLDPVELERSLATQAELDPSASEMLDDTDTPLQTRVRDTWRPDRPN
jgi:uncharacterized protein with GYD domain